jgi:serine/threonine protein kinase
MEKPSLINFENLVGTRYKLIKIVYNSNASPTIIELYEDIASNCSFILKKLRKALIFSEYQIQSAIRELRIHSILHHPNVVEVYDCAETDSDYLLLMEFIPRHDYFTEKIEVVKFI